MSFIFKKRRKIVIVGLGVSGLSLAKQLQKYDLIVNCWDDDIEKRTSGKEVGLNITDIKKINFEKVDYLILSPGIPHYGPKQHLSSKLAQNSKCKIVSEIELLKYLKNEITLIGITGTNGKTTTASCLEHVLKKNNFNSYACGNIGLPFTEINIKKNDTIILEASSFQLERIIELRFNISILLNISEDHLDRHQSIENYAKAKMKIFESQKKADIAIICIDDQICKSISNKFKKKFSCKLIIISATQKIKNGIYLETNNDKKYIINKIKGSKLKIPISYTKHLVGFHNLQNLLAVYACCMFLKMSNTEFLNGLKTFRGLEHRLEFFAKYKNISFYNDSKATNYESAKIAITNISNIFWLVGGRLKKNNIHGIEKKLNNVKKVFTFGESSTFFFNYLEKFIDTEKFNDLENAIKKAFILAKKSSSKINILLSPACSSFDQFKNFEERGAYFKNIVSRLIDNDR